MDADTLEETLEADYETELSRLGSSKALYAVTGGEMAAAPVVDEMAGRYLAAADRLAAWSTDGDPGAGVFRSAASTARDAADRLAAVSDAADGSPSSSHLTAALDGLDGPAGRAGGLLAWVLVTDRTLSQVVGFFVGNASPTEASIVRDLRANLDAVRTATLNLLDDVCGDADDWGLARDAAGTAIEAAYDHYVDALESMGIKVKPVC